MHSAKEKGQLCTVAAFFLNKLQPCNLLNFKQFKATAAKESEQPVAAAAKKPWVYCKAK